MESPEPLGPLFSKGYRTWMLVLLVLTNALNLADRQTIAIASQAIKLDLKFTDLQIGVLQGLSFAIFYTAMGIPLARLAERFSRARIIATCLALFATMSALCGTARGFFSLLPFRIGVAVGDAGFGPPVASLIGDHYPMKQRASVMSIIWLGAPIGVVTGATVAGWLSQHVSWRAAFFAVGTPALIVALIAFLTLREPPRGQCDPGGFVAGPPPSASRVLKFLFAKPSVLQFLLGAGIAAVAMNSIGQFLGQFLARNYHMGLAQVGPLVALIAGGSMASGLLLGGFGMDWAARKDRRWYVWGPALGLILCTPLFLLGFNQPNIAVAVVVLIAAHVCMFVYYAPSLALAQNMVGADMRASSAFLVSVMLGLVGIGIGPTLVGWLSDHFATRTFTLGVFKAVCPGGAAPAGSAPDLVAACRDASATGLRSALMVMTLLCLWAAVHYLIAARHLRADLDRRYVPGEAEAAVRVPSPSGGTQGAGGSIVGS